MRLYKRGQVFWIEWVLDGKKNRISTHLKDKSRATSVLRQMQTAQAESKKDVPDFELEEILDAVRRIYGEKVATPARERMKAVTLASMTPLDEAWSNYLKTATTLGKLPAEYTLGRRENEVKRLLGWLKKERPAVTSIEAVTNPVAVDYAAWLADSGRSTKTRKNILGELGSVWKVLAKQTSGLQNPWSELAPRVTDSERGEPFTRDEEKKVLVAAKEVGNCWYEMSVLARHTGLRYGSLAKLVWSDVHLEEGYIETIPPKTKNYNIKVTSPITSEIRAVLKALPHNGDFVFPIHAEIYEQNNANRWLASKNGLLFAEVLDRAGVKRDGITFHSWRHTFRTRLAEAGVTDARAMELCGHTNLDTSKRYDHAKHVEELRAAVEAAAK